MCLGNLVPFLNTLHSFEPGYSGFSIVSSIGGHVSVNGYWIVSFLVRSKVVALYFTWSIIPVS